MKFILILGLVGIYLNFSSAIPAPAPAPAAKGKLPPPWMKFMKPTTTTEAPTTTAAPLSQADAFLQAWFGPKTVPEVVTTTVQPTTTTTYPAKKGKPTKAAKVKPTKKPLPWLVKKITTTTTTESPPPPPPVDASLDKEIFITKLFAALSEHIKNVSGDALPETTVAPTSAPETGSITPDEKQELLDLLGPALIKALTAKVPSPDVTSAPVTDSAAILNQRTEKEPAEPTSAESAVILNLLQLNVPTEPSQVSQLIALLQSFVETTPAPSSAESTEAETTSAPETTEKAAETTTEKTGKTTAAPKTKKPKKTTTTSAPETTKAPEPEVTTTESSEIIQLAAILKTLLEQTTTEASSAETTSAPESPTTSGPADTTEKSEETTPAPESEATTESDVSKLAAILKSLLGPTTEKSAETTGASAEETTEKAAKTKKPKKTTPSAPEATTEAAELEGTTEASLVNKLTAILKGLLSPTTEAPAPESSEEETTSAPESPTSSPEETTEKAEETTTEGAVDDSTTEFSEVSQLAALLKTLLEPTTDAPTEETTEKAAKTKKPKKTTTAPETTTEASETEVTTESDVSKLAAILKILLEPTTEASSAESTEAETTEKSAETTASPDSEATTESSEVSKLAALLKSLMEPTTEKSEETTAAPESSGETTAAESSGETTSAPVPEIPETTKAPVDVFTILLQKVLNKTLVAKNMTKNVTLSKSPVSADAPKAPEKEKTAVISAKDQIQALLDALSPTTESPEATTTLSPSDALLLTLAKHLNITVDQTAPESPTSAENASAESSPETTEAPVLSDEDKLKALLKSLLSLSEKPEEATTEAEAKAEDETTEIPPAPKTKEDVINLLVAGLAAKEPTTDAETETTTALALSPDDTKCKIVVAENGPLLTLLLEKVLCPKKDDSA